jgi:MarR family transcriptional regulator, organic hydroperoxide resistance regulator
MEKANFSFTDESYELSRLLFVTMTAMRKARQRELQEYSVHSRRVSLLLAIDALEDKATPVAIGQWLLRERHSISELLGRAEKDGLVERKWDLDRKNGVRVVLTPKGREVTKKSAERRSIHAVMSALSAGESERLRSYLMKLRNYVLEEMKLKATVPLITGADRDYELYGLVIVATELILKARHNELKEHNIDAARSGVLLTIGALGDRATPVAIGQQVLRTRHSISELLSRAEKDGLVEKRWDLDRKNGVRVVLTPKGEEVYRRSRGGEALPRIMSFLSQEERDDLKSLLLRLLSEAVKTAGLTPPRFADIPANIPA